ncbi:hypothetical protein [Novosphingobium guangzhouense]|nr:hypothetical protein [Novosphingobium guangzhouense]
MNDEKQKTPPRDIHAEYANAKMIGDMMWMTTLVLGSLTTMLFLVSSAM